MGAWSSTFDGSDGAADWFADALKGCAIDAAIEKAFKYSDTFDQMRAAAYLITVLGCSSYVWPGDLDKLDGFLLQAERELAAMIEPGTESNTELGELWGKDSDVFDEIRGELQRLREAHKGRLAWLAKQAAESTT